MAEITLRGRTITVEKRLVTEECYCCHVLFAVPEEFRRERMKDKRAFYCPNGHSQHYLGKTEEHTLREQLEEERRRRQRAEQNVAMWQDLRNEASDRADRERNRANGYKGYATRITKRAKAGVCPCCNRTFKELARHMATKHPQFTPIEIDERPAEGASVQ